MPPLVRLSAALAAAILAGPLVAAEVVQPVPTEAPAGDYVLDPAHARLIFSLSHLGFSNYTALFSTFDARLGLDPAAPETATLDVTVDPTSIQTFYPDPAYDFDAVVAGPDFLDAARFPEITFRSTSVRLVAPDRAAVTGEMTLHGVTRRITLSVTFNGGYAGHPLDRMGARIGFSATGTLFRSDFGIGAGIPEPGSKLGIGDEVSIRIEAEFVNPDVSGVQVGP